MPPGTVSFTVQTSATHIADYMYLVDTQSRMRWYSLILRDSGCIQQPVYSVTNFTGEHPGFDPSSIIAIRYGQYAMNPGNMLTMCAPVFETGVIDHCEVAGN